MRGKCLAFPLCLLFLLLCQTVSVVITRRYMLFATKCTSAVVCAFFLFVVSFSFDSTQDITMTIRELHVRPLFTAPAPNERPNDPDSSIMQYHTLTTRITIFFFFYYKMLCSAVEQFYMLNNYFHKLQSSQVFPFDASCCLHTSNISTSYIRSGRKYHMWTTM